MSRPLELALIKYDPVMNRNRILISLATPLPLPPVSFLVSLLWSIAFVQFSLSLFFSFLFFFA